ncbi:ABC transporter permease [Streptomyces sp. B6B3]|uniref:ABC transporter permease subunit n=1 Tax=Streptomyces sp. B6B3 TaxID=3153570 RepID=UPI00325CF292
MASNATAAVLAAEWTKIRTLRSTLLTPVFAVLVTVGLTVVSCASVRAELDDGGDRLSDDFHPVDSGFVGLQIGLLALVAFAALLVTGEYGSGMIRTSFAAVPDRRLFYAGKLLAVTAVVLPASLLSVGVSYPVSQAILGPHGVPLGEGASWRAVLGAPLYVTLLCLLAVGVAALLRTTARTLSLLLGALFALSPLANALPGVREVARFLPDHAGAQVMTVGRADEVIGPWYGLGILAAWTVALVLGGLLAVRRRDC